MSSDNNTHVSRRAVVTITGVGGIAGLSGCVGFGGNGDGGDGDDGGSNGGDGTDDTDGTDGGTGDSDAPETITLGQPASLSGQWDFLQPGISQATDAAVNHINEAGGP
ncbi:hypothetical protein DJ71_26005, partial [Halorubrum sp. E3]